MHNVSLICQDILLSNVIIHSLMSDSDSKLYELFEGPFVLCTFIIVSVAGPKSRAALVIVSKLVGIRCGVLERLTAISGAPLCDSVLIQTGSD